MKKRLFSLVLALTLCMGLAVPAIACDTAVVGKPNTIVAGNRCTAIIDENGDLWIRGYSGLASRNAGGTEVEGRTGYRYYLEPTKVLSNVTNVSCGWSTIAAIKVDGSLWVWGDVTSFQRGDGKQLTTYDYTPTKVMENVAAVSCGEAAMAVIKTDGSLWMWGDNDNKQIGNGGKGTESLMGVYQRTPQKIMDNVSSVCTMGRFTLALKADGTLWAWGVNDYGQLGNGGGGNCKTFLDNPAQDTPVQIMDNVSAISAVEAHAVALKKDGTVWCWGDSFYGQVGNGTFSRFVATPVEVLTDAIAVSTGTTFTAAIRSDHSLWMWGRGDGGCLLGKGTMRSGDGNIVQPTPVKVVENVAQIAIQDQCFLQKTDGTWWAWGGNHDWEINYTENTFLYKELISLPGNIVPKMTNSSIPIVPAVPIISVGGFTDVKASDYYADAVLWAVDQKITSGTSSTTFSPGATCSKAQILTFLWRANGSPEPTAANPFTDIKPADYFYKAALWAAEKGMVSGSTFGGNTDCTRAMTVEYLWKLAGSPAAAQQASFTDVPDNADYAKAVAWAVDQKITSGTGGGKFSPATTCTRGQIVTFLHRAMT